MAASRRTTTARSKAATGSKQEPAPSLNQEDVETSIAELSEEFARRVGALADLFASWREPDVARAVIDSMIEGDPKSFGKLSRPLKWDFPPIDGIPPVLGKCYWLSEVIEKIVPPRTEVVCRLRMDLSPTERARYYMLVLQFSRLGKMPALQAPSSPSFLGPVVPPGEFLEALKAENLVTCREEPVDNGLSLVLGPPSRVCL
jgi:hypothetical protein